MFYIERLFTQFKRALAICIIMPVAVFIILSAYVVSVVCTILTPFKKRPVEVNAAPDNEQEIKLATQVRDALNKYIAKKQEQLEVEQVQEV
jgi:large-conductance mechanosensitive channel